MMKKILFITFIFMISCQKKVDDKKIFQNKINELQALLDTQKDSMSIINSELTSELDILKTKLENFEQLIEFSLNKKSIFEHIMYQIENPSPYDDESVQRNFHNSVDEGFSFPRKNYEIADFSSVDKDSYSKYILSRFDRSSKNIELFFNSKIKNLIFSYFKNKHLFYKNSGLKLYVKCLILSYEESSNNQDGFNELYKLSQKNDSSLDGGKHVNFANTMVTDKLKELFVKENINTSNKEIYYEWERFVFHVYSFWARRINENNEQIVYQLLKEFNEKIE
ncbi:hypothetical protein [Tenacibaculum sp. nBUS_03]|uniref:hypothetical protein n=1 Tax=Tenacibaculum sp. nBUS_03 TaxID=3395320 RepID=UPI003EBDCADA